MTFRLFRIADELFLKIVKMSKFVILGEKGSNNAFFQVKTILAPKATENQDISE